MHGKVLLYYVIKNQRGASKIPPNGVILRFKATRRGLWMSEPVLYGIRLLAKQFLGTVLDIEVDQSVTINHDLGLEGSYLYKYYWQIIYTNE